MPKTYCPDCDAVVSVEDPREGASITCRECGTELEVISVSPFEVDYPLDYDEGWDDDLEEDRSGRTATYESLRTVDRGCLAQINMEVMPNG